MWYNQESSLYASIAECNNNRDIERRLPREYDIKQRAKTKNERVAGMVSVSNIGSVSHARSVELRTELQRNSCCNEATSAEKFDKKAEKRRGLIANIVPIEPLIQTRSWAKFREKIV